MRVRRPRVNNFGDKLRRAGWVLLTALFIFTGLGVGVYAFWQGTHSLDNTNSQTQQNPNTTACSFSGAQSAPALAMPTVYKTSSKVNQLQETDLQSGSGSAAKAGDCVQAKYYGTIASSGKEFDEDFTQPLALQFLLGEGYVIPGWDQGLIGMKAGGERRLVIPSKLAYGATGQCKVQGQSPCTDYAIPPNTDLVFVVKLLNIK